MPREPGAPSQAEIERVVLPHLDAAYNLARWLVGNPHDAEDVVQEACLRAMRFIGGYREGDARAWLLRIVRNTAYTFLEKRRPAALSEEFDESLHVPGTARANDVESEFARSTDSQMLQAALEMLPVRFREVVVLRELEGLAYKEIAEVMEIPMGTVMSSLARGPEQLRQELLKTQSKEAHRGVRE
ncbi:MAG: sigma-70 family RNA polymerase sigma factor [Candidatus Acidiferrales bacterium]